MAFNPRDEVRAGGSNRKRVSETEETKALRNQALLEQQQQMLAKQDEDLDQLLDGMGKIKEIGQDMRGELDLQEKLLDNVQAGVARTDAKMTNNIKRVEIVENQSRGWCLLCTIFLLLVIIVLLLATDWACYIFAPSKCKK